MPPPSPPAIPTGNLTAELRAEYQRTSEILRESFSRSQDGRALVCGRSALIDQIVAGLWQRHITEQEYGPPGIALAAIGGYGRQQLFPYSDIDLLFLCSDAECETAYKAGIRALSQEMWDIGLRVSVTTRTLQECERLSEENPEFTLSLLDRRYIAGDLVLFEDLDGKRLPSFIEKRRQALLSAIARLTEARHAKFQHTLFHLEPNVKEGPGGLRDFHTCEWLSRLLPGESNGTAQRYENDLWIERRDESEHAYTFLLAVRGFLHYRNQRDDNMLYWQAQDDAAKEHLGLTVGCPVRPDHWMRQYFRHGRAIDWLTRQMLENIPTGSALFGRRIPFADRAPILGHLRQWRGRTVLDGCPVRDGRISLASAKEYANPDRVLTLFQMAAWHRLQLSPEAEGQLAQSLALLEEHLPAGTAIWEKIQRILLGPDAASTLRAMHAMRILELVLPEFQAVDALVIRDAYHRYTVDEHTFLIVQHLHALDQPGSEWEKQFAEILSGVEEPALLYLAALLHDTGKAHSEEDHAQESLGIAEVVARRWGLNVTQRESILRLIRNHLEMSRALRKDIFDAETIRAFAGLVGTPNDLRLLTLLTYADIHSVNPEALTPWKAENLWRLYMATANALDRNVDEERIAWSADATVNQKLEGLATEEVAKIHQFLRGLPHRYLRTRTLEEIMQHAELSAGLAASMPRTRFSPARVILTQTNAWSECTILTRDRPSLFADIAGALTAWGMDIIKADAFSNASGVVIDTFRFIDRYRTLELNPDEVEHFQGSVAGVAGGNASVEKMLAARAHTLRARRNKIRVQTKLSIDNVSSSHSTILQVIAQDTSGLLRRVSLVMARQACDISVALIDTEGEMAIDVFYLTRTINDAEAGFSGGEDRVLNSGRSLNLKLDDACLASLKDALLAELG